MTDPNWQNVTLPDCAQTTFADSMYGVAAVIVAVAVLVVAVVLSLRGWRRRS